MSPITWLWSKRNIFLSAFFFLFIFLLSRIPTDNSDTFYHVKTGDIFLHQGFQFHDIYSYAAQGRMWYPTEWLFQVLAYSFQSLWGYASLSYFAAIIITTEIGLLFLFLRKYFRLSILFTCLLGLIYFSWNYKPFFVIRPQILVLVFFTAIIINILNFLKTGQWRILLVSLVALLFWTNVHSSVIFGIYLFFAYAGISFLLFYKTKKSEWFEKAKKLGLFGFIGLIISILPPVGLSSYHLLLIFLQHIQEVKGYVLEWNSLFIFDPSSQLFYLVPFLLGFVIFAVISYKKKDLTSFLLFIPLLPFLILPLFTYRNSIFAFVALALLWGWNMSHFHWHLLKEKWMKVFGIGLLFGIVLFYVSHLYQLEQIPPHFQDYPAGAADFLLNHYIAGNMFNTSPEGTYLLYRLYPQYKVFTDLRTDVYLCCEIPRYQQMIQGLHLSDAAFYNVFTKQILQPYNISFIILPVKDDYLSQRITHVLTTTGEKDWQLVFWDDQGVIFVKNDGKNVTLLQQFGTTAVTPFEENSYRQGKADQAFAEYSRMEHIADSSVTSNALSTFYFIKKQPEKAKEELENAIHLDPTNDAAYLNLAELFVLDKKYSQAIALYKQALQINPGRSYTYMRLGQLYLVGMNDQTAAIAIWTRGEENFSDSQSQQMFETLIQQAQASQLPLLQLR